MRRTKGIIQDALNGQVDSPEERVSHSWINLVNMDRDCNEHERVSE